MSKITDLQTRVEDYLDDRIQTIADLENVDDLLARVQEQQDLLKQQLKDAQEALDVAQKRAHRHAQTLQQEGVSFQQKQNDIDRRLMIITGSEVSDDAVKKFELSMNRLQRLEVATGYLELLQRVDGLSHEARKNLQTQPRESLTAYTALRSLRNRLQEAQPAAEGAAPHLVDQVERETTNIYDDLRKAFETDFRATLEKMKWPQKELNLLGDVVQKWSQQTELLLDLQDPDLLARGTNESENTNLEPVVLLPLEIMIQPLAARFRYHFYGERPTNRLDKPEYFLSHILDLIDRHNAFVSELVQPILDSRIRNSDLLENIYPDAISSFISGLIPMVTAKCLSVLPQISSQPQLLSHFIHELMSFDSTLRDSWAYRPFPALFSDWKGLTWTILSSHGYFKTWLEVEKDFALSRYKIIRDAPESNDIDFDGVEPGQTKPTKGAIRVNDLLETITDRYRALSSFSQKMKFLMDIQLSIFDDYHGHLHGALQAYLVTSHTAGRLLQGQSKAEALGLKGLETLSKIYGSAEFLERKMSDWSDDIFFLELWDELQDRAGSNQGANASVGTDLRIDEVAAKTSSSIKASGIENQNESDGGALFDETALSYRRLREQSETEVLRSLDINIRDSLKPFIDVASWASLSSAPSDFSTLAPSAALDSLLQTLTSLLGYLRKVLAIGPLRRITRHCCQTLQKEVYDQVLMRHTFSAAGVAQFKRDILAVQHTIDSCTDSQGIAQASMKRLDEALTLLGLPIRTTRKSISAVDGEGGWGFEVEEEDDGKGEDLSREESLEPDHTWGLWEAEKFIFKSNESARYALSEMGLGHISHQDARNVLKQRVEING